MAFTKLTEDVNYIQALSDTPNEEEGLTAQELKAKFDMAGNTNKTAFNGLIDELEDENGATSLGASAIDDNDTTENNIQAKLEALATRTNNLKAGGVSDGTITTNKIADSNITTAKIADNGVTTNKIADGNITTAKIADGNVTTNKLANESVIQDKIETATKAYLLNSVNHTAESFSDDDTSENNVQAKLTKLYEDMQGITQGGVADGAITTAKLANNSVTTDKILDSSVTGNKIEDNTIEETKIVNGYGLIPSGVIVMWSGAVSNIPTGWYLCNGLNNTPDLRNRFIVGAGNNYSVGDTGGSDTVTLTINQIPSHTHNVTDYPSDNDTITNQNLGGYGKKITKTTSAVGGGQAHENRPPYYALAYIMKA